MTKSHSYRATHSATALLLSLVLGVTLMAGAVGPAQTAPLAPTFVSAV